MNKTIKLKNIRNSTLANIFISKSMTGTYDKWVFKLLPFSARIKKVKWKDLRDSLAKEYNPKKYGYITMTKGVFLKNTVVNGNHRIMVLKDIYPEDYEIEVEKVPIVLTFLMYIVSIILPVIMLVCIVLTILLKLKNIVNNSFKIVNNFFTQIFRSQNK